MKLKGLPQRVYNVYFHTHTVAGIAISFGLFIIFYCGAFSLFRDDIYRWENPEARFETPRTVDLDRAMAAIQAAEPGLAETAQLTFRLPDEKNPYLRFFGAVYRDDSCEKTKRIRGVVKTEENYAFTNYENPKTTLSNTIYRLHYLGQLPAGLYLSGFIAVFFLFASVTGVMIHWRNIVTKFYAFTVRGKWKQIWANAHTVLGMIGLPFQIIYAVTGALFGLLFLLLLPSAFVLFGGDTNKVLATVRPDAALSTDKNAPFSAYPSIQAPYQHTVATFPGYHITSVRLRNYGREDGLMTINLDDEQTISGTGDISYALSTGEVLGKTDPRHKTYTQSVLSAVTKLHFASFGGLLLRIIYFVLAMITCFMILSGVLLWRAARDNKRYTDRQKRFHHRVTKGYLAICLGLFPATALIFIANKAIPLHWMGRATYVNAIFFLGRLGLFAAGLFWNDFRRLNKNYLRIGGVLALLVPLANGLVTGDWFWRAFARQQWYVGSVDLAWLMTGLAALTLVWLLPSAGAAPPPRQRGAAAPKRGTTSVRGRHKVAPTVYQRCSTWFGWSKSEVLGD